MAEKTIVDKPGETVGVGIAMSSDVAGAIKNGIWRGSDDGFRGSEEGTCEKGYGKDDCQKTTCQEGREKSRDKEGRQKDARKEDC